METESAIFVGEVEELQLAWVQYVEKSRNMSAFRVKILKNLIRLMLLLVCSLDNVGLFSALT